MSPKIKLLATKSYVDFPIMAPISEHKTNEIELRLFEADNWLLRTLTANPLSFASIWINSRKKWFGLGTPKTRVGSMDRPVTDQN